MRGRRPELGPIDMVTCNLDMFDDDNNIFKTLDRVYPNKTETCALFARSYRSVGIVPVPLL